MDKPTKLNERLTLIAHIAVVLGIVFLAMELRQNTSMMQAQIRDSITEKQMRFTDWLGPNRDAADVFSRGNQEVLETNLTTAENVMYALIVGGIFREWENSHYQYERGLFTREEFEPRAEQWRRNLRYQGFRAYWETQRDVYAPSFRAEIDAIVAEIEN